MEVMKPRVNLVCTECGYVFLSDSGKNRCEKCGGILEYIWDEEYLKTVKFTGELKFWRYKPILPSVKKPVSLGEGGTPLQEAQRLAEALSLKQLALKDETRNPTNSFKDRSAALIVSDALGKGFSSLVCATNGNHGASVAAYSAKANIACHLIVPKALDIGKLAQMMVYNAEIVESGEMIEESISRAITLEEEMGWYQATTELNPLSIEGLKTIAYEIVEQKGEPDWMFVAMGSGVTISSLWKGFKELETMERIRKLPRLVGIQAKGCSPIVSAFDTGEDAPKPIEHGETEATAIRVSRPIFGELALKALRESKGFAVTVSDEDMLAAGREIARLEGIFAEPASAATVASLSNLVNAGKIDRSDRVICLITSSGLKTDDILQSLTKRKRSQGLGSMLTTKEKILRHISSGETYGYEIWKTVGKGMTIGAVYQHIADLDERGLISSSLRGKRRYYEITDRGRRTLSALDDLQVLL
ncbi:MAG: threonine synthase [Candidatus Bathyarchaeia archaeon]|jgi:threonine synthase